MVDNQEFYDVEEATKALLAAYENHPTMTPWTLFYPDGKIILSITPKHGRPNVDNTYIFHAHWNPGADKDFTMHRNTLQNYVDNAKDQ